ncbi:MAG TPA: polysaccharide biosynthesis/export family protein [Vicinamibacterales bacterium]|nr:polysaccharide biosynthesis/export family protein [Vicinamibacterales bacterium]
MKSAILVSCALALATAAPAAAQGSSAGADNGSPPASRTTSVRGPADAVDYRLVPGDKLRIEVYKDPQLSQSLQIRPDGKITLPLVGDVPAAGATPRELAQQLTERLREYVTAPVVTVIVAEAMPPMVYVMGEVNSPGAQPMGEPITVLQALAVAGGFKDFANPKKIRILRRTGNGTVQTIQFNYKDAVEGPGRPVFLQPGDTVIVP